jgi:hypothetical protein
MLLIYYTKIQVSKAWTFLFARLFIGFRQWIFLLSIFFLTYNGATASQPVKPQSSDTRTENSEKTKSASRAVAVTFPSRGIGILYLTKVESHGQFTQLKEIAVAKDIVHLTVIPDRWLLLRCTGLVLDKPNSLNALAPDDLDSLEIAATPIEELETFTGKSLLTNVARLTGLKQLTLKQFPAADLELSRLSALKKLQHLTIELCEMDGSCLKALSTLPEVYDLDLSFNELKTENFRYLKDFRKLKRLILHGCKLNDSALASVGNCSNVEDLALNQNARLTNASMKSIASMKKLRVIDLRDTRITARGLQYLTGLDQLRSISVTEGYISPEQLAGLRTQFPHTKITSSGRGTNVDDDTRRIFAPMPR